MFYSIDIQYSTVTVGYNFDSLRNHCYLYYLEIEFVQQIFVIVYRLHTGLSTRIKMIVLSNKIHFVSTDTHCAW